MYIDLDIEDEIRDAVEDYLANDGGIFATLEELDELQGSLGTLVKEQKELNYWKADRKSVEALREEIQALGKKIDVIRHHLGLTTE